jgi:hypothetical protein
MQDRSKFLAQAGVAFAVSLAPLPVAAAGTPIAVDVAADITITMPGH